MNNLKQTIILEGTDGVGKTVTIEKLKQLGIVCQDRSKDVISKNMVFDIDMKTRCQTYENYLKTANVIIIFLINNDSDELMKRIYERKNICDYDLDTVKYNQLYLDTFNYMKENNMLYDKLFLVDCTNKSINEQVEEVRRVIDAKHSSTHSM